MSKFGQRILSEKMRRLPQRVREEDRYNDVDKTAEHEKIARETESFLKAGGHIQVIGNSLGALDQ